MREYNEKMDKLTMPCGELVPNDEELFAMTEEELFLWNKADLLWVINYSGHKMDSTMPNYESWRAFYERASRAKNRHHWDETPYYD